MEYLKNENLATIRSDWKGNPFDEKQFRYLETPFYPSFRKIMKWQMGGNPKKAEKKADKWRPQIIANSDYLKSNEDFIVWLGHASFLIQLNGVRLIIDPVLYNLPFLPRFVQLPYSVETITNIDYILLSHDHRDHCDRRSIRTLLKNNQPKKILAPLGLSQVIDTWVGNVPIEEASWYQVYDTEGIEIIYLPTRHWSRRFLHDFNRVLWGAFIIRHGNKCIYFGSDSGYASHYKETQELFPNIDVAMLGIGAYMPSLVMQEIHKNPQEAFQAFNDLNANYMIPMHYGTYDLSDEPISEPFNWVHSCFEESGKKEQLWALGVSEVKYF